MLQEDRKRILQMLKDGKITIEEADQLLAALAGQDADGEASTPDSARDAPWKPKKKHLRVVVESANGEHSKAERINIRIPIPFLKAGMKLAALMPEHVQHRVHEAMHRKGIHLDLGKLKADDLEELLQQLSELEINVDEAGEKVRIFTE